MPNKEFSAYLKEHFPHTSSFLSGLALLIVDSFVLFGSIMLGFIIMNFINSPDINLHASFWYALFIPVILIVYGALGLYPGIANSPAIEVKKIFWRHNFLLYFYNFLYFLCRRKAACFT